jgi:hypothetical protein
MKGLVSFLEETGRDWSLSAWRHSKKTATCKPGKELSLEPEYTDMLISDSPGSGTVRHKFKLPCPCHFVAAAEMDWVK